MKAIVVGAGIIGVTAAWFLRREGFDVLVVERRDDVAREASHANAGVIAPAYVTPWAAPGMPAKILRSALAVDSPVVFRPRASVRQWRWIGQWLRACDPDCYAINKQVMQRLAHYSRHMLHELRQSLDIEYGARVGYLQLLRTARDRALVEPALAVLRQLDVDYWELDAARCEAIEPALRARRAPLFGGVHLPQDESGDCEAFARALRMHCERVGVRFAFGVRASRFERAGRGADRVGALGVRWPDGRAERLRADRYVLAAGVDSVALAAPLGVRLPLYPVSGYSITVPVDDADAAPRAALMDEAYKTAIVRLGDSVRVAGTAELAGWEGRVRAASIGTLRRVLGDWFPQAGNAEQATPWVGRRPMTPGGTALLGPTPIANLLLDVGHGSTGWAMACGSAAIVAALAAGRPPPLPLDGLTLAR